VSQPEQQRQLSHEMQAALNKLESEVITGRGGLRLASLATVAGHEPQVRTVIIRSFTQPKLSLIFFCRADDAKFGEIASNPAVELVCYERHPDRQIRLAGTAVNITDTSRLDAFWSEVNPLARRDYVLASLGEMDPQIHLAADHEHAEHDQAPSKADHERAAIISQTRAPLFRAVEVTIRRVKLLTFAEGRWIPHSYLPPH
jgi:pyridoxine/pyridoxamine 5'-phosphate oxidase